MNDYEWMEKLAHYTDRWQAPRVLDARGERWTVATNGKVLVALKGVEGPYADLADPRKDKDLIAPDVEGPEVPIAEVRAWAGTAPEALEEDTSDPDHRLCPECEGEGEVQVDHWCDCDYCEIESGDLVECEECMGDGYVDRLVVTQPVRAGRVGPALLNLDFVAWALDRLPNAGPVTVKADHPDHAVYFDTADWRLLVMPIHTHGIESNPDYAPGPHPVLRLTAEVST